MARELGVRVCKYANCRHGGKVNINTEFFVKNKNTYYHEDCYKERTDLQTFRSLWVEHISSTVVYSQLNCTLNQLIKKGVSSEYLLFALQYIIQKKLTLNHPAGIRYYLDYAEIKEAYNKKLIREKVANADFTAHDDGCDDAPKFSVKRKPSGFNSILRR